MHSSPAVHLTCVDCHGGDPNATEKAKAHVLPAHPEIWKSSANPQQSYTALLKESPELFSGLVWNGQWSIDLGLADALGSVDYVARDIIKAADVVNFTPQENFFDRVARKFGATLGRSLGSMIGGGAALR